MSSCGNPRSSKSSARLAPSRSAARRRTSKSSSSRSACAGSAPWTWRKFQNSELFGKRLADIRHVGRGGWSEKCQRQFGHARGRIGGGLGATVLGVAGDRERLDKSVVQNHIGCFAAFETRHRGVEVILRDPASIH